MSAKARRPGGEALQDLAALALLTALCAACVIPLWLSGRALGSADTFIQHVPDYVASARLWAAGRPPLWNPWLQAGMPQLGYPESAALYPGIALFHWLSPAAAMTALLAAHWLSLALGMYVWARVLGMSPAAGLSAAATAAFCRLTLGRIPSSGFLSFGWMPWLGCALTLLARTSSWRWAALSALAIALPVYGGHPQFWLYWLALCLAYSALLVARAAPGKRPRLAALMTAAWSAGALLSLLQALPALEFLAQGPRQFFHDRDPFYTLGWNPQGPVDFALSLALNWRGRGVLEPDSRLGLGLLPLLLAFQAARRRGDARFFAAAAAVGTAWALSSSSRLSPLVHRVPVLSLFHSVGRANLLVAYPLALLAGFGVDAAAEGRPDAAARPGRAEALAAASVAALALASSGVSAALDRAARPLAWLGGSLSWPDAARLGVVLSWRPWPAAGWLALEVCAAAALWLCARRALHRRAARAALAAGVLAAFWPQLSRPARSLPHLDAGSLSTRPSPAARRIQELEKGRGPGARVATFGFDDVADGDHPAWPALSRALLVPNVSELFGIPQIGLRHDAFVRVDAIASGVETADGYGAVARPRLLSREAPLLPLLGARYLVLRRADAARPELRASLSDGALYEKLLEDGDVSLWRSRRAFPRFWLATEALPAPPRAQLLAALDGSGPAKTDFARRALAEGLPSAMRRDPRLRAASLSVESYRPDEIRLGVDAGPGEAFLVDGESFDPGWTAAIDGAPAPLYRTDLLLRGVAVPAGRHEVLLRYRPRSVLLGLAAAGLGVLVLLAALALPR